MRPLRFALFLGLVAALLSAAGYLWAPLVGPISPRLHLATPPLQSSVAPLRIAAVHLPSLRSRHLLPLRVEGTFLLHRRHPETREIPLHVAAPAAARAQATF